MNLKMLVVFIILLNTFVFSDYIVLKNGMAAKTDILDTIGCKIQIRRNGNIVQIAKDDISFIVCNAETLYYNNFICTPEIASKKSNIVYEDGYNSEKVKSIIEKMNFKEGKIRDRVVYYCKQPIFGDDFQCCWDEKFESFENDLKTKITNVKLISHDELFKILKSRLDTNTILLPFSVKFAYSNSNHFNGEISPKDLLANGNISGGPGNGLSYTFVKVTFNLIVIDLKDNTTLFNQTFDYTKNITDYTNLFDDEKQKCLEAKKAVLENVLLNSLNSGRKKFTKLLKE
jgi:hypothetical protein